MSVDEYILNNLDVLKIIIYESIKLTYQTKNLQEEVNICDYIKNLSLTCKTFNIILRNYINSWNNIIISDLLNYKFIADYVVYNLPQLPQYKIIYDISDYDGDIFMYLLNKYTNKKILVCKFEGIYRR
jgi:hypothetical protein